MKYLKLCLLSVSIYLSGVGLFCLTVFQGISWFFPTMSFLWAILFIPLLSVVTVVLYEILPGDLMLITHTEDAIDWVIEHVHGKIVSWGLESESDFPYFRYSERLVMYSFFWFVLLEALARVPIRVGTSITSLLHYEDKRRR